MPEHIARLITGCKFAEHIRELCLSLKISMFTIQSFKRLYVILQQYQENTCFFFNKKIKIQSLRFADSSSIKYILISNCF